MSTCYIEIARFLAAQYSFWPTFQICNFLNNCFFLFRFKCFFFFLFKSKILILVCLFVKVMCTKFLLCICFFCILSTIFTIHYLLVFMLFFVLFFLKGIFYNSVIANELIAYTFIQLHARFSFCFVCSNFWNQQHHMVPICFFSLWTSPKYSDLRRNNNSVTEI